MKRVLALVAGIVVSSSVLACNAEMGMGSFDTGRHGALVMAAVIGEARRDGVIERVDTDDAQALAKTRAQLWKMKLGQYQGEKPQFFFYQALENHWTDIRDFAGSTQISLHRPPTETMEDGVVMMSHGDVADALLNGKLTLEQAEQKGLVVFSGPEDQIEKIRQWIDKSIKTKGIFGL
ncbi:hypothetical protein ACH42_00410 [Endozoicomonas sp. (ex Bugula neritina AB1)]|nr:hypothetical protein ACH42_00410 [Endozoicomonas sp. (ex Bugula neritina AB1)]